MVLTFKSVDETLVCHIRKLLGGTSVHVVLYKPNMMARTVEQQIDMSVINIDASRAKSYLTSSCAMKYIKMKAIEQYFLVVRFILCCTLWFYLLNL